MLQKSGKGGGGKKRARAREIKKYYKFKRLEKEGSQKTPNARPGQSMVRERIAVSTEIDLSLGGNWAFALTRKER